MNPIKDSYPNGICPDCLEPIPDDVNDGDECSNCKHVFWVEMDDVNTVIDFDDVRAKYFNI